MNRFVLNETSYHGAGAINAIADEMNARGFMKALVASDPDLIKFGIIISLRTFLLLSKDSFTNPAEVYSKVTARKK